MGELKALVTQIIVILACATGAFMIFAQAAKNANVPAPTIPLNESMTFYQGEMTNMTRTFLNATEAVSSTPATSDPLQVGWAMLSAAGRALTIFFTTLTTLINMAISASATLIGFGLPTFFVDYGLLFLMALFALIIFSAIYKWWL